MTEHDQYFRHLMQRSRLGAVYRRRLLYPRLTKHLRGRLLDIGCGIGDMLAFRPNSVGVDVNPRTVNFCVQRGLHAELMMPDRLPFESATFDSAVLDNVLEHILDPAPLLAEVHRILKPEGLLLVGVPGSRGWKSDPDHKIYYDEASLAQCLSSAQFKCRRMFYTPLMRSSWLSRRLRQYCIYGVFDLTYLR